MASASKKSEIDKHLIKELADLLGETGLSEIEIEQSGLRIRVARSVSGHVTMAAAPPEVSPAKPASVEPEPASVASGPGIVTSPMVGTAYYSSAPGSPAFVKIGDTVSKGQTLLIVEAMKTMNQIPAPIAGTVKEIFVDNSQPVEFGEPLIRIE